ncbi:MAG: acyl transferase [Flavisolibacter sp.]|nr:acyl transferase [Flavisolibacter sp.]
MPVELPKAEYLEQQVFRTHNEDTFYQIALSVFQFQYHNNPVYRQFCTLLNKGPEVVNEITDIPFLPISFFKTKEIKNTEFEPELIFQSSTTTGSVPSRHFIKKESLYRQSFLHNFELFYGAVQQYTILGLLPSYLERGNSSLVYMVQELIHLSKHPMSDFYLYDFNKLYNTLTALEKQRQKTLLIGVTYALLEFAQSFSLPLQHTIVMETGGMKGRREEWTRSEVHAALQQAFSLNAVHSEYGMTELLSQAYAFKEGIFSAPEQMRILLREEDDPYALYLKVQKPASGAINIIDLANLYSCSFLATDDRGRLHPDGTFEVLGRLDNSDIRGCSLLYL